MRTLVLSLVAVVSLPVSAQQLQVTISGDACVFVSSITECNVSGAYTTPATISYDIDTRSGQQTFHVGQPGFGTEGDVLIDYEAANLVVTNYSAILGGQTHAFAAHTTGSFGFAVEGADAYDFAGGVNPAKGGFNFDSFASPLVSATEFATFDDPLASLLLKYRSPSDAAFCGVCLLDGFPLVGQMTITAVPSPGPLVLFVAGLVGLALSRRNRVYITARAEQRTLHAKPV